MTDEPNRPRLSKAFGFVMADLIVLHGVRLNDSNVNEAWDTWLRSVEALGAIDMDRRVELSAQGPRLRFVIDAIHAIAG